MASTNRIINLPNALTDQEPCAYKQMTTYVDSKTAASGISQTSADIRYLQISGNNFMGGDVDCNGYYVKSISNTLKPNTTYDNIASNMNSYAVNFNHLVGYVNYKLN